MTRRCKVCKKEFNPSFNNLQSVCSPKCGLKKAELDRNKKQKQALKDFRNDNKTVQERVKEAQAAFNGYIRERDRFKPCVSCGRSDSPQWDAGHYRSRGAASHLRFNLLNTQKQCNKCNRFLSGNVVEFRKGLIERIGTDRLDRLENDNEPRKFDREYLERVKKIFRKRTRIYKKIRKV